MKRAVSVFFSLLIVFIGMMCTQSVAYAAGDDSGACGDAIKYTYDSANQILTLNGTGATANYSNLTIGSGKTPWYSYREEVKKVVVGEGITQVGNYIFANMSSLTTVILPSTLTAISMNAFYNDTALSSINLGDTKVSNIGINAFENCKALTTVTLPETMVEIGTSAFRNAGVKTINFPKSCTTIGMYAFYGCAMSSLTLPDTISSVGMQAFAQNSFLLTVYVYNANLEFGKLDPFSGCQANLTFYGHGGSTTQTYAESKGYHFVSIDSCVHLTTHPLVTKNPTCTEKGSQDIICDTCGVSLRTEEIKELGHDRQLFATEDQSKENGHIFETYRCVRCNDAKYDTIQTTHVKNEEDKYIWFEKCYTDTTITAGTCTQDGNVLRRCSVTDALGSKCSALEYIYTKAPGHVVTDWTVTVEPTCTTDGSRTGVCTVCQEQVTETIKGSHSYVCTEGEVEENGHRTDTYTCSVCGDSYTTFVHVEWVTGCYTTKVIATASCLMTGSSVDTCSVTGCTERPRTNVVPATGHTYRYTSCDGTTCSYKCVNKDCGRTTTRKLADVESEFIKNLGQVSEHLFGYYYDLNNDNWVNARDYVIIDQLQQGVGVSVTEENTTEPITTE